MSSSISQRMGWDTERARASTTFNGTFLTVGSPLQFNPVTIIFDNQTDVSVPISVDGTNVWKTFSAGQALILDCRANHGIAPNWTPDLGVQFFTNAAVGTAGSFRISVNYAR